MAQSLEQRAVDAMLVMSVRVELVRKYRYVALERMQHDLARRFRAREYRMNHAILRMAELLGRVAKKA